MFNKKVLTPLVLKASITSEEGKVSPIKTLLLIPPRTESFSRVLTNSPLPPLGRGCLGFRTVLSNDRIFNDLQLGLSLRINRPGDLDKIIFIENHPERFVIDKLKKVAHLGIG